VEEEGKSKTVALLIKGRRPAPVKVRARKFITTLGEIWSCLGVGRRGEWFTIVKSRILKEKKRVEEVQLEREAKKKRFLEVKRTCCKRTTSVDQARGRKVKTETGSTTLKHAKRYGGGTMRGSSLTGTSGNA